MPSGAKKRKAAKKKLQKEAHNNGAHPQGSDDPKPHDDRESDGGEVEREPSEEGVGNNHEEGTKETSLGEENVDEIAREMKSGDKFNDVTVEADDASSESQNGNQSEEHKSSSSSSSEDDEVEIEKEKPDKSYLLEASDYAPEAVSVENPVSSEVVYNSIHKSIPVEESVKEVVSLPQEPDLVSVTESVPFENSTASDVVESGLKQSMDELSLPSSEKNNVSSVVASLLQDSGSGKLFEPVDTTARDNEGSLSQPSGVTTVDRNGGNDLDKESEKHNYSEKQPLVSSAPLPVRRTSWMNCCGLFEVLSGGSSR